MANRIDFQVGFNVDKTGLNDIQQSLQQIQQLTTVDTSETYESLQEIQRVAQDVGTALNRAFNADLGTVNVTKFNQELEKSNLDIDKIYTEFSKAGDVGQSAFRKITTEILSTNEQIKQSSTLLDNMATTMGNTIKWGIASSAMNKLTGSVQEAYGYVKNLDTSLNNIRIVTEKSAEDMAEFAVQANNAAKALGSSTTDYTNASLIYYQQGLSDEEVAARAETTIKTANVTGQSAEEVSEELTAVWNGYQITSENAEASIDMLAAVAANSAANLEELSTGMSKVASSANAMGVSEEQLTAQLATIVSVTQQAPESVGTALRTIYARMSTISAGGIDEDDGATLTSYTAKMNKFGISVLDANGQLRDMGDVITEVGDKWEDFSREQQISLAQTMAGTRQYNYVLSLFENWDQYNDNLLVAENSLGTLQKQQDIYMESTEAHLEQLNAAWEDVFDSLLNGSDINAVVDVMTNLVNILADFIDGIGGGTNALLLLGGTAVNVFSTQIASGIQRMINNLQIAKINTNDLAAQMDVIATLGKYDTLDTGTQKIIEMDKERLDVEKYLTKEQNEQDKALLKQLSDLYDQKDAWDANTDRVERYLKSLKNIKVANPEDANSYANIQPTIFEAGGGSKSQREDTRKALEEEAKSYQYVSDVVDEYTQKLQNLEEATNQQNTPDNVISINGTAEAIKGSTQSVEEQTEAFKEQMDTLLTGEGVYKNTIFALQGMQVGTDELKEREQDYTKAVKESGVGSDEAKDALSKLERAVKESGASWNDVKAEVEAYNNAVENGNEEEASNAILKLNQSLEKESASYTEIEKTYNDYIEAVKSGNGDAEESYKKLEKSLTNTSDEYKNLTLSAAKMASALQTGDVDTIKEAWNDFAKALNEGGEATSKESEALAGLAKDMGDINDGLQETAKNIDENHKKIIDSANQLSTIEVYTKLAGGLMQGVSAIRSFSSAWDALTNEDLSWGERATQVISGLAMTFTMGVSAINAMQQPLLKIIASMSGLSTSTIVATLSNQGFGATIKTVTASLWQEVAAAIAARAATMGISSAVLVSGIAILAAAIGGVSVALYNWSKSGESAEDQLKRLGKEIDTLETKIESCTSALETFKETASDYSDAVDALEELEKGTDEYAEAIQQANKDAKELIETYDLLTHYHYDENGMIVFDEGVLEETEAQMEYEISQAQQIQSGLKILEQEASVAESFENGLSDVYVTNPISGSLTFGIGSDNTGFLATIRTQDQEYWTNIAEWFNTIEDGFNETNGELLSALYELGETSEVNVSEAIKNLTRDQGSVEALENLVGNNTELSGFIETLQEADSQIRLNSETFYNNTDAINDFYNSIQSAGDAVDYYASEGLGALAAQGYGDALSEAFGDNKTLINQLTTLMGYAFNNELENSYAERIAQIDVSGINNRRNLNKAYEEYNFDNNDEMVKAYLSAMTDYTEEEIENAEISKGTVTIGDETVLDEDLGTIAKTLAKIAEIEQIQVDILSSEGSTQDEFANSLVTLYSGLDQVGESFGVDLAGVVASAMTNSYIDTGTPNEGLDLSALTASLSPSEYKALIEGMQNMTLPDWKDLLGLDSYQEVIDIFSDLGFDSSDAFEEAFVEAMGEYDYDTWMASIYESAKNVQPLVQTVVEGVQGGSLTYQNISEDSDYEEMIDYLNQLEKQYPELTDEVNILSKSWLVGTQDYITALQKVQDAVDAITLKSLKKDVNDTKEAIMDLVAVTEDGGIDISADPAEFLRQMDLLMDQEYAVEIELHTEAENEFNSVVTALDDIHDKASLIGEDFIVAAEDIRELNNTFPGILDGVEDLHDGTVRLNEETVQSAINAAELEAAADVDAARQKMLDAQDELRVKQTTYQQIADAAAIMAQAEIDQSVNSTEAQEVLTDYLTDYEIEESAVATEEQISDSEEVAEGANESGRVIAEGYGEAYTSATHSSAEFAEAAVANMQYVASGGEQGQIVDTKIDVNYQGANYNRKTVEREESSSANEAYESLQAAMSDVSGTSAETWEQISEMYQALADSTGASINDIDGMLYELGARASDLDNTLTNIRSGNGSSGSSSSGSSSTKEPSHEDYVEDEVDRYHDINLELEAISENLSRLQDQESKLVGQDLLDNLNAQLATLDDQIDATQRKLAIANDEAAEMRASLSAQGVTFDENGYITNYASIMESQLQYVNDAIDLYNAMSAEEQDLYKDTLDAIKQNYSDFVDSISDYDDLISDFIPGLEDDIQSALDQEIELQIEKFTMEVEIRLNMEEAEKDWDEFYRKVILGIEDEDIMGNAVQDLADLVSYFNTLGSDITDITQTTLDDWLDQISSAVSSGGTGSIQALTDQVNGTLSQLAQMDNSGWSDVYGDNRSQALEDLQTYYTELMNQLEEVQDLINNIEDSYLDMIDEAIDAFDEQVEQYEYINDLLNHDINLVSLIYGDDAYAQMARYYEQIEKNNNDELDFLRQRVAYAQQMMEVETDDEARKKWQEEWESALSDLNDKVEDSVQNIIDKYVNAIEEIINDLNDAVTNGLGLDFVNEEWDLMSQESEIYLDTINSLYAIQDLQNKYLSAIDDTDSITAQQKLASIMEEQVAYLQEKGQLTQYDVDRAELQYEIALKQIALEEAQQNKNSMRLRRDSQGNYTYQYVSDSNEVAELQQQLLDLQNQLYNFDKDAYLENLNDMYSMYEEFTEKIEELYEDQTLSAEEREQMIAMYVEYYGNIINDLVTENSYIRTNLTQSATDELAALYEADADNFAAMTDINVENFENMTEEEINDMMTNLIPQWDSGVQHMADTFAGEGGFIGVCSDAFEQLEQATYDYEDSLEEMANAAGIDLDEIANGYDEAAISASSLLEANEELIDQYATEIQAIQNVIDILDELIDQYKDAQKAAEDATAAAYSYWQQSQQQNAEAASSSSKTSSSTTSTSSTSSSSSSGSSSSSSGSSSSSSSTQGNGNIDIGDKVLYKSGIYYYDSYGMSPSGSQHQGEYVYVTNYKSDGRKKPVHISTGSKLGSGDLGWLEKSQIEGYDTGGYTGDWDGGDGALAVLHQKEMVLNASDTENMLQAVGLVRDMATMLSSLDTSVFTQIGNMASNLAKVAQAKITGTHSEQLDQEVHIDASFPNVRDQKDIENAFNNLINYASQYAYNTNR